MMGKSKIEWTDSTWNPLTGCTKISLGCKNCYAERMAIRLQAMGNPNYKNGFDLALHENAFYIPLEWKKPKNIFVNSMSDLFHEDVPLKFILRVFDVMRKAHWHTFQILTKRANRLYELNSFIDWPNNVWMGVSIENNNYVNRKDLLIKTDAFVKFISFEPLIGPISEISLDGINWVIVGGESGPHARYMDKNWVIDIRNKCIDERVPFFFKQWGGTNKKKTGRILEGKTWDGLPVIA